MPKSSCFSSQLFLIKPRKPDELPLTFGASVHNAERPHSLVRTGGTQSWLMEYTASGAAELRTERGVHKLAEGDIFLYQPQVRQDYGMIGEWDHYWVSFLPRSHWSRWLEWPEVTPGLACLSVSDPRLRKTILELFREGIALSRMPWHQTADFIMSQVERILLWLDTINPAGGGALLDNRVRDALQFMAEHHRKKLTLDALAQHCSLSPSRFSHLFRSEMHIAPLQYLNRYRIDRAKEMLRWTTEPIAEVAYNVGFDNPLYFSRVFHKQTGHSPRDYRRQR